MARVLVDTSAWIEFYHPRGAEEVKRAVCEALEHHEVAVVAPVVIELLSGAGKESDYELLQEDLRSLTFLSLSWKEAAAGGELAWKLAREGRRVPTADLLIAAAAQGYGYEIWHFGDKHFEVIEAAGGPSQRNLRAQGQGSEIP